MLRRYSSLQDRFCYIFCICFASFLIPFPSHSLEMNLKNKIDIQSGFSDVSLENIKETKNIFAGKVATKLKVFKKVDNKEFGIFTRANLNTNPRLYMKRDLFDQYAFSFEGTLGKFSLGKDYGAGYLLQTGTATFQQDDDSLSVNDSLLSVVNDELLSELNDDHDILIIKPGLWSAQPVPKNKSDALTFFDRRVSAAKGTFISPVFNGLRIGLSYIPESTTNFRQDQSKLGFKNITQTGLIFAEQLGNIALKTSLIAEFGTATHGNRHNLKAWEYGINISYSGFEFGSSYGDWGRSGLKVSAASSKPRSYYWTTGLGYSISHWKIKTIFLNSIKKLSSGASNKFTNLTLELDYKILRTLSLYMQSSQQRLKKIHVENGESRVKKDIKGNVFLFGARIIF